MPTDHSRAVQALAPVGVFDSGVGGLTVLRALVEALPEEDFLYLGDTARLPYGTKSPESIRRYALQAAGLLKARGVKCLVVACNTASAAALHFLREQFPRLSFVGMEPAVKPAVAATRSGVVGVLATGAALNGEKFHQLVARHAGGVRVITQPCPGLVEQVETGDLDGVETAALVRRYALPLLEAGADTLVLGCTHYPLLRPLIQAVVGDDIKLIDTGAAVARQVARLLERDGLARPETNHAGRILLRTTGDAGSLSRLLPNLWPGQPVEKW